MPRELDEIYIRVEARTEKAKKQLTDFSKSMDDTIEKLRKKTKKLSEDANLTSQYTKATKEQKKLIREQSKALGEVIHKHSTLLKIAKKINEEADKYDKSLKEARKDKDLRAAEKEVKQFEQLADYVKRARAEQQDYYEFLRRSSMENARFADRLDKRDRTRNVFENLRRGMDKGAAISMRFHAEENSIYRLERSIGIASSAFDRARHPAEALTDAFYTFQRVGYAVQTALGVLAGTVGDIVGGMMALVGVAGAAAGSLVAVAGAFANMAAGMITAKFALSGVGAAVQKLWEGQTDYNRALADAKKRFRDLRFEAEEAALSEQEAAIALEKARENLARVQDLPADNRARREAELEFQRAELNYRRAKARVKDTKDELKRGPASNAAQNPFNNLTKSQIAFAKYLATLKPVVQSLKEAAASSFLPPLQKSIQVLVDNLVPALKDGLNSVGEALGDASRNFTDAFKDKANIKLFREFLENSKPTIRLLGAIANKAFGGILVILKAAQPITDRFARWVFAVVDGFEKWAKSGGEDTLRKFFKLAGDVSSELGSGFKLIFGGLSNIVKATFPNGANSGAGGVILQWLKEIGAGFKLFTGQKGFSDFLKNATENAKTALGTIGQFLKIFIDLAGDKNNQEFWMIIRDSVPYVKKILEDGQKAGPAFANLLNSLFKFVSVLSESTAINVFFNTLNGIVSTFAAILQSMKPILDGLGILHGAFLAIALAGVMLRKGIQIFMGIMMKLLRVGGAISSGFNTLRGSFLAVRGEGNLSLKTFNDMRKNLQALRLEATNLKRIEILKELAKSDKQKQIAQIRQKMEALRASGKATKKEMSLLQGEIDELNNSYKRLKTSLREGSKDAKTFTQLLDQQKVKADAATFSLDKYAKSQDRMRFAGRMARGGGMMALGAASSFSAMQGSGGSGIGSALQLAGGAMSFMPGPTMFAGMGLSIIGSIVDGFDQARKQEQEAKEQKRIEIKAKLAEIRTEKLNEERTGLGALVGSGRDLLGAQKTFSKIEEAARTSIKASGAEGIDATGLTNALLTSDSVRNLVTDPKTRAAVIKTASAAAASGIYSDTVDGVTTVNVEKLQAALTGAIEGAGTTGGVTGIAGIQDLLNRLSTGKYIPSEGGSVGGPAGTVVAPKDANKILNERDRDQAIAAATAYLTPSLDELKRKRNLVGVGFRGAMSPEAKAALDKLKEPYDLQIAAIEEAIRTGQGFFQRQNNPLRPKVVYGPPVPKAGAPGSPIYGPAVPAATAKLPGMRPDANEVAFRKAMANMGKPKDENKIPSPTKTFYDQNLKKSDDLIRLMIDVRNNTQKSGGNYTYTFKGAIP